MFKIKRVYEKPDKSDGMRALIDRLWPRGLIKEKARIDKWMKEIAPSNNLRKWFGHKQERWEEFKARYLEELKNKKYFLDEFKTISKKGEVTLSYAAKDKSKNNAKALSEFLKKQ